MCTRHIFRPHWWEGIHKACQDCQQWNRSAKLEVEVKLVYAEMRTTKSWSQLHGNLRLILNTLDDTTMASIIRCVGVSYETRHHPNFSHSEGTAVMTHIPSCVSRVKSSLVTWSLLKWQRHSGIWQPYLSLASRAIRDKKKKKWLAQMIKIRETKLHSQQLYWWCRTSV